jgi:hypothetical protein
MQNKTIKFKDYLVELILKGEKNTTWRLFDDKDLKEGDKVDLINKDTMEKFAGAKLVKVYEKTLGTLTDADWEGHEKFASDEEMYETYKKYYGREVDKNTIVKIIRFELIQ